MRILYVSYLLLNHLLVIQLVFSEVTISLRKGTSPPVKLCHALPKIDFATYFGIHLDRFFFVKSKFGKKTITLQFPVIKFEKQHVEIHLSLRPAFRQNF